MNVRPLSRAQISVSVGAAIPRSVRVYTVPSDIVAVYPQFRGHRFVVVDDEIVIVEPRSYRVVTVLPMGGERRMARSRPVETTGSAAAAAACPDQPAGIREEIRTVVMREPACRLRTAGRLLPLHPAAADGGGLRAAAADRDRHAGAARLSLRGARPARRSGWWIRTRTRSLK